MDHVLSKYMDEAESVQRDSSALLILRERFLRNHADLAYELRDHFENEDAVGAKFHSRPELPDLGRYTKITYIGRGAMGIVYQAKDQRLGRQVALKVLPEEFTKDPHRLARFEREAKLLASLNHPNIAAIHSFEHSDEVHFLVLELVEGETLAEKVKKGPLPVQETLEVSTRSGCWISAANPIRRSSSRPSIPLAVMRSWSKVRTPISQTESVCASETFRTPPAHKS